MSRSASIHPETETPRVLVACEMSGRVRTRFAARGWDAWSADILPDEAHLWNQVPPTGSRCFTGQHYQGDVRDIIDQDWDLVIGHPPCTDLSQAGANRWKEKRADGRMQAGHDFFRELYSRPRSRAFVVIENPRGVMSAMFRPPDQEVEPFWFGDPLQKKIDLWFRAAWVPSKITRDLRAMKLPLLVANNRVEPTGRVTTGGGSWRTDKAKGLTGMNKNWEDSQGRSRRNILRSITSAEVARAFADQWGPYIEGIKQGR